MAAQAIATHREGAEVHTGHEECRRKATELLEELGLPRGLLPLPSLEEVGYNRVSGFVWLRQSKGVTHAFDRIGKSVWYAGEVTAFVEPRRMRRLTGVKSKELLIWVPISEIAVEDPQGRRITFRTPAGIGRAFPVSAFADEPEKEKAAAAENSK